MTKEEKQALEDKAKALREEADKAHQAAAETPGDEALQKAAEDAEDAASAAQADADAAVVDAPAPELPKEGEEEDEEGDGKGIDFDKELQALEGNGKPPAAPAPAADNAALSKAERALHFTAKRVRELGGDPEKVLKPNPETPPAPPAPAPAAPAAPQDDSRFVSREDFAEAEAAKLARTEAERKVIMHHFRHSIKPTGNLITDLQNAYLLAHKGRITRSFDEIRRAAAARPSPGNAPGRRAPAAPTQAPQLNADEEATMLRRGYKKLPDGNWESKRYTMRFDHTRRGWVTERKK